MIFRVNRSCFIIFSGKRAVIFRRMITSIEDWSKENFKCYQNVKDTKVKVSKNLLFLNLFEMSFHQLLYTESESEVAQSRPTLSDPMDCSPPGSSGHGDSPSKNTGVGCHALLQGIFPTQGSNPGLQHCRRILYLLSH